MPELPEMQALAERLDALLAGSALTGVEPIQFSALKTYEPAPDSLVGRSLEGVGRRGKYLTLRFGGPRILVHLSQGGRVVVEDPPKATRPKGAVVRLRFEARPSVMVKEFGTERRAGWWVLVPGDDGPLKRLGPEPGDDAFAEMILRGDDPRRIHTILRDQRTVAGIGRGYSDDILHRARLSPYATLPSLDPSTRRSLLDAVRSVLDQALEVERRRAGGLPTKLGDHFAVHNRYGKPCPRCGEDLRRVSYESHEVTYCPRCQTGGKVLADRRLSRLVR
ncbi:MAG: DNA-formamidopyrimidine glycosylase family protein [Actinomycetota bacterium]